MLRVWNLSLLVRHVRAHDPRHVPHPVGRDQQRARVRRRAGRRVPARRSSASSSSCRSALIAWRGDRLRSPGAIDSPISREGAFLANNVVFTVFAFIVLLGTVFPLLVEALAGPPHRRRCAVLRSAVDADRDRAAVPHGASRRCCRGARRRGSCSATGCSGRRGAASGAIVLAVVVGARRLGAAGGLRARRVRRRVGAAPARARHPPAGLAAASSAGPTAA